MNRLTERLIDLVALGMLLIFAYVMRVDAPELAGGIAVAACAFWLTKNAAPTHDTLEVATAKAAAEVLRVASEREDAARKEASTPTEVEIVNPPHAPVPVVPVKPT